MRARAGSALRPPTRTPATLTPAGTVRVGVDAGAAAQASPAAANSASRILSTGRELEQLFRGKSRDSVRPRPYPRQPDGCRNLGTRTVLAHRRARARPGAGGRRGHGGGARAP